jgi:dTMP kinase
MKEKGIEAIFTREPGGTPISEKIRAIILDRDNTELDPMTETLLYAASRSQHVSQLIRPALDRGRIVVCDRFVDSSIAYQEYARGLGECVSIINEYAICGCIPDLTILLKVEPDVALSRLKGPSDRLESEDIEFHRAVYRGYLELEKKYPERIFSVDASLSCEEVRAQIIGRLADLLGE